MAGGVYKIVSPSGKVYVGQSNDIHRRFIEHKSYTSKTNTKLGNTISKYGIDNLEKSILYKTSCQSARDILELVIIEVNDLTKKGLNHLNGGGVDEIKNGFKGKNHSEEFKQRMSDTKKGIAPTKAIEKRKKKVYCTYNNKEYNSISSCARDLNVSQPLCSMMLNGKTPNNFGLKFI